MSNKSIKSIKILKGFPGNTYWEVGKTYTAEEVSKASKEYQSQLIGCEYFPELVEVEYNIEKKQKNIVQISKELIRDLLNIKDLKINIKRGESIGMDITLNFTKEQYEIFINWCRNNNGSYSTTFKRLIQKLIKDTENRDCPNECIFIDINN